VQAYSWVPISP